ncbi:hypothetical protein M758_3G127800 [Ceratodon purpureus]|nr:hypothetical protein M758_3G127800 [Ceratodon purpureus]
MQSPPPVGIVRARAVVTQAGDKCRQLDWRDAVQMQMARDSMSQFDGGRYSRNISCRMCSRDIYSARPKTPHSLQSTREYQRRVRFVGDPAASTARKTTSTTAQSMSSTATCEICGCRERSL